MKYTPIKSQFSIEEINDMAQKNLADRKRHDAAQNMWLFGGTRMSAYKRSPKGKKYFSIG